MPTATFSASDFSTPDGVAAAITTLGELLGAEPRAAELATGITDATAEVVESVAGVAERPRVLVLLARGGKQLIMGAHSATTNLVELAGGESLASTEGWRSAVPADPETILALDPDVILVQDFRDAGLGPFRELLENPALAEVAALAGERVVLVDAETTSGTAGVRIAEGLAAIADVLHPCLR